jgi:3-oxoadipate enol-lactonase/4-carboxymuconolactone decarboxylase
MTVPRLLGSIRPAAESAPSSSLLVLLPSLGTTSAVWEGVAAELSAAMPALRILTVDLPGHGASPLARESFSIGELSDATLRLVDEAGGGRFHIAGLSLGGAVALELVAAHPHRVLSFASFCSGSRIGTTASWAERAATVRESGTASLVTASAGRWFTPGYFGTPGSEAGAHALTDLVDVDDESYALCCDALGQFDRTPSLGEVQVASVIVSGEQDPVTTTDAMRQFARLLPNAAFAEIAGAAHLAPLERPLVAAELLANRIRASERAGQATAADARAAGLEVRRAVLGDAHVDGVAAASTPETEAFQDFITRYAWGEIWARPELSRRERSIATLAALVTGGHEAEQRMHMRAALRNGLSRVEIAEVILHTALYAGLPAANAALAIMRGVFAEESGEPEGPAA